MKCPRCQGLVVLDQLCDPGGPYLHVAILRCLNCGGTTYLSKSQVAVQTSEISKRSGIKAA